MEVEL